MRASHFLIMTLLLGASSLATSQTAKDVDKTVDAWKKSLSRAFDKDARAILVDVDLSKAPIAIKKPLSNPFGEAMMAAFMNRTYLEGTEYITLSRSREHMLSAESIASRTILDQLLALGPEVIQDLSKGRHFSDLPMESQVAFARIACSLQPGMVENMIAGEDYEVKVQVAPVLQYVDPKDQLRHSLPVPSKANPMRPNRGVAPAPVEPRKQQEGFPLATKGDLDFGKGDLVSLSQLLNKAAQKFKIDFDYDRRLAGTALFIKGQWTKERLTEALATVYKIDPPKPPVNRLSVREGLRSLLEGPLAGLLDGNLWADEKDQPTARELLKGKDLTYEDLIKKSPSWAQYLDRGALTPGSLVSLRLGLQLSVTGAGTIPLANSVANNETQTLPVTTRNEAGFIIVP